jgi:hypothetical protein
MGAPMGNRNAAGTRGGRKADRSKTKRRLRTLGLHRKIKNKENYEQSVAIGTNNKKATKRSKGLYKAYRTKNKRYWGKK